MIKNILLVKTKHILVETNKSNYKQFSMYIYFFVKRKKIKIKLKWLLRMIFCVISFYLIKTFNVNMVLLCERIFLSYIFEDKNLLFCSSSFISYDNYCIWKKNRNWNRTEKKVTCIYSSSLLKMCYNLTGVSKTFGTKIIIIIIIVEFLG